MPCICLSVCRRYVHNGKGKTLKSVKYVVCNITPMSGHICLYCVQLYYLVKYLSIIIRVFSPAINLTCLHTIAPVVYWNNTCNWKYTGRQNVAGVVLIMFPWVWYALNTYLVLMDWTCLQPESCRQCPQRFIRSLTWDPRHAKYQPSGHWSLEMESYRFLVDNIIELSQCWNGQVYQSQHRIVSTGYGHWPGDKYIGPIW